VLKQKGSQTVMRKRIRILSLSLAAFAAGCGVLRLTDDGAAIRLAKPDQVASCKNLGRVSASVLHQVGIIPRHPDAVREEIEVVARNSAAGMGADTMVPASGIQDGKQTFDVYLCARS
jgi:hypothetical protein